MAKVTLIFEDTNVAEGKFIVDVLAEPEIDLKHPELLTTAQLHALQAVSNVMESSGPISTTVDGEPSNGLVN